MNNINNGHIEGLPEELSSVYVCAHYDDEGETGQMSAHAYLAHELKGHTALTVEQAKANLVELGYDDSMTECIVSELSGGRRMQLALVRARLLKADIYLLDEPTNHLDVASVEWLVKWLQSESKSTALIVSHDTEFMDMVCTNVIHYESQKLQVYKGNLSAFVVKRPEAKTYFQLDAQTQQNWLFPKPSRLDGINTATKSILTVQDASFTYPGKETPQLTGVDVRLCLSSRVAVVGPNGAGKSTLIKMMVGETIPDDDGVGAVWKHHNLNVAYVAQHSFHHVERHLNSSPVEYLQWRFYGGQDREVLTKDVLQYSPEEEARRAKDSKIAGKVEKLTGSRHMRGGAIEYEVKFVDMKDK
jgi:elongation factor 3